MPRALLALLLLFLPWGCVTTEVNKSVASSEDLLRQGDSYFRRRALEAALDSYKMAAAAAETEGRRPIGVAAEAQAAHAFVLLENVTDSAPWLARAAEGAEPRASDPWSRYLLARGAFERATGHEDLALATFAELYDFAMKERLYERAMQAAHMATLVAGPDRVSWAEMNVTAAKARGNSQWVGESWQRLGWILDEDGRFEEALQAFRNARDQVRSGQDEHAQLVSDWTLARALRRAGRVSEARSWIDRTLARAERRYDEFRTRNDAEWVGRCLEESAEVSWLEGNRAACLGQLRAARTKLLEAGIATEAPELLARLDARIAAVAAALQ